MGVLKQILFLIVKSGLSGLVVFSLLIGIPGIPPNYDFEAFTITPPMRPEGWMTTNTILDKAEVYFEGPNMGPESTAVLGDEIFTGDTKGNIFRIRNGVSKVVAQLAFPCVEDGDLGLENCSYPLGMRFDGSGHLLLMDLYGGLIKVNVDTGHYEILVSKWLKIDGKASRNPEDLDIAKDGSIYWSDGSTVELGYTEFLGQASGRFLKYDPKTKQNTVLMENIHLSNGVCLSADEDFVLVADLVRSQIKRYHLKGEKTGQSDIFVDGLPGYPDNIRSNGKGGFYVALFASRNDQFSWPFDTLAQWPLVRKAILRSKYLIVTCLKGLGQIVPPNVYLDEVTHYVNSLEPILRWNSLPKTAAVVELSDSGEIIGILNGQNGKVHSISQIVLGQEYAYINAPFSNKVWRIKIQNLQRTNAMSK